MLAPSEVIVAVVQLFPHDCLLDDTAVKRQPRNAKELFDEIIVETLRSRLDTVPLNFVVVGVLLPNTTDYFSEIASSLPRHPECSEAVVACTVNTGFVTRHKP